MADVSGKGAGAALYMALSCTLVRTYARRYPTQPELVLGDVNRRILTDTSAKEFVTVFYGILDPATGRLVYSNAGHWPPLCFHTTTDREVQRLVATGIPLGILEDWVWRQESMQIEAGDLLVLYTDGITEARNEQDVLFGEERLVESVRASLRTDGPQVSTAQGIQDRILADVHEFVGSAPQSDDLALTLLMRQ
jgi:sigma-B regulation protein RsbU (phosphoserine phosphatase)